MMTYSLHCYTLFVIHQNNYTDTNDIILKCKYMTQKIVINLDLVKDIKFYDTYLTAFCITLLLMSIIQYSSTVY